MIVLDTNVVSALMRDGVDPRIRDWFDGQPSLSLWTTAITVFEIRFGLARLAHGRRLEQLVSAFDLLIGTDLAGRVIEFDQAAAEEAARLMASREDVGRSVDLRDTMIAGICLARRAPVATRNVRHFADAGLTVIDPWSR